MQRSALCRSRRELSNEYLLAKIGVDTAENEPLEVWGKIIQYYSFVSLGGTLAGEPRRVLRGAEPGAAARSARTPAQAGRKYSPGSGRDPRVFASGGVMQSA